MNDEHRRRKLDFRAVVAGLVAVLCLQGALWLIANRNATPPRHCIGMLFSGVFPRDYNPNVCPPELSVSSDYRRAWPRDAFAFRLTFDSGFEIDTFSGTITKDMGHKPDTTIVAGLTDEELNEFYEWVLTVHYFDYAEPHPPYGVMGRNDEDWLPKDFESVEMCVRSGSNVKTLQWSSVQEIGTEHQWEWMRLWWLAEQMYYHAVRRPEYLALPPDDPITYW